MRNIVVVYSPDDNGYYLQRHDTWQVSKQVYKSEKDAREALDNNTVKWEK